MSAAVALPLGRGVDIAGQRFGMLTALHVVQKRRGHNHWLLVCDCERIVTRAAADLIRATDSGVLQMCNACKVARYGGPNVRRLRRMQRRAAVFLATRRLYTAESEARMRDDIRRGIAERLGVPEPLPALPFELPIGGYSLADATAIPARAGATGGAR